MLNQVMNMFRIHCSGCNIGEINIMIRYNIIAIVIKDKTIFLRMICEVVYFEWFITIRISKINEKVYTRYYSDEFTIYLKMNNFYRKYNE